MIANSKTEHNRMFLLWFQPRAAVRRWFYQMAHCRYIILREKCSIRILLFWFGRTNIPTTTGMCHGHGPANLCCCLLFPLLLNCFSPVRHQPVTPRLTLSIRTPGPKIIVPSVKSGASNIESTLAYSRPYYI